MNNEIETTHQTAGVVSFLKIETAITEVVTAINATKFDVMTPRGIAQAREVRAQIKALRINLGKAGKAAKSALNTEKRRIDTEVVRLTDLALTGEDPLHKLIKDREDVLSEEKRVRDEAERQRKIKIQDTITQLAEAPKRAQYHDSYDVEIMLIAARKYSITHFFQEFAEQAEKAKNQAVAELTDMLDHTRIMEEMERMQALEKLRLEDQRREQDERQARQDAEQAEIDRQKAEAEPASIPEEKPEDRPEPTGKTIKELADTAIENTLTDDAPVQEEPEWVPSVHRFKKSVLEEILLVCRSKMDPYVRLSRIEKICLANMKAKK